MSLFRIAVCLAGLTVAVAPASATHSVITDCDRGYYANFRIEHLRELPDIPDQVYALQRADYADRWHPDDRELLVRCTHDASASLNLSRLARAAGDLAARLEDVDLATAWYERGIELGDPASMTRLYWLNFNAKPNQMEWERQRSEIAASSYHLAVYMAADDYERATTVQADLTRALLLYEHSAWLGWSLGAAARARLSDDPETADRWWRRADELSSRIAEKAQFRLMRANSVFESDRAAASALIDEAIAIGGPGIIDWLAISTRGREGDYVSVALLTHIEQLLVAEGWLAAPADGRIDRDTVAALRRYQSRLTPRPPGTPWIQDAPLPGGNPQPGR